MVLAAGLGLACGDEDGGASSAPGASGDGPARSATVAMESVEFQRQNVRIAVGGEVTWVNKDESNHTSTSKESATETGGVWDTGIIEAGQSATVSFDRAGTFDYLCTVHPSMVAQVTVGGGSG